MREIAQFIIDRKLYEVIVSSATTTITDAAIKAFPERLRVCAEHVGRFARDLIAIEVMRILREIAEKKNPETLAIEGAGVSNGTDTNTDQPRPEPNVPENEQQQNTEPATYESHMGLALFI